MLKRWNTAALTLGVLLGARFASAQSCQPGWSAQFAPPQVGGTVNAQVVFDADGPGPEPAALYIAGIFDTAGGVLVNNVARWDGTTFTRLGGGLTGGSPQVVSLVVLDDDGAGPNPPALYAAGFFFSAGGVPVNRVAKWDGAAWSPMPEPPRPVLEGILRHLWVLDEDGPGPLPPNLFMSIDEITIASSGSIWKWQGSGWVEVGPLTLGVENIRDMAAFDPDGPGPAPTSLYVVGQMDYHSTYTALQRLTPSGWTTVASQVCDIPSQGCWGTAYRTLATYDPDGPGPSPPLLVMGGLMSSVGGVTVSNVAAYNGTSWSALGGGVDGPVASLASIDDLGTGIPSLYVGGTFTHAGAIPAFNIARWNGSAWWSPAAGTGGSVYSIIPLAPGIVGPNIRGAFLGGSFLTADGVPSRGLAAFTPASWAPIGRGVNNTINALATWTDPTRGPGLYAAGAMTIAGGQGAVGIARFDGDGWSNLSAPTNGPVNALAPFGDQLIIGGQFSYVGPTAAAAVAAWNGSAWSPLGSGLNNIVHALAVYNEPAGPRLFAGGRFSTAGGQPAVGIARWDGAAWSPVANGASNHVYALTVFDDGQGPALYIAGRIGGIARWNGVTWSSVPGGPFGLSNAAIYALAVHDDGSGPALYAGGDFFRAGAFSALNIARYKNGLWTPLGSGTDGPVRVLASLDPDGHTPVLFAGGDFTTAGGVITPHAARWFSGFWHALDGGANGPVLALAPFSDPRSMYLGGSFTTTGAQASPRIARWTECPPCYPNCDASAAPPVLNVNDFICFLNRFAAADAYANCDRSTTPPFLNVNDFACFLNAFAAGCP